MIQVWVWEISRTRSRDVCLPVPPVTLAADAAERAGSIKHVQPTIFTARTADFLTVSMAFAIFFDECNFGFQARIINGPVNTEFHLPLGKM
jgi:hypothetical protein